MSDLRISIEVDRHAAANEQLAKAIAISRMVHRGQKYGEKDYFLYHVAAVASRVAGCTGPSVPVNTWGSLQVAYLHDVVEDTQCTLGDLSSFGFHDETIGAVDALTRREDEVYMDYITRVCKNRIATFVKYHDLLENMAHNEDDSSRMKRYQSAMIKIKGAICT